MLFIDNMDPTTSDFLARIVERSGGDTSVNLSMYEIGTELGLDKEGARQTAEDVIGRHLVEIVSLGGSIRLTDQGLEAAEKLGFSFSPPRDKSSGEIIAQTTPVRGTDRKLRVMSPVAVQGLRKLAAKLIMGASPETQPDLSLLLAHICSPKPKAGVAAELLLSILSGLDEGEPRDEVLGWLEKLG